MDPRHGMGFQGVGLPSVLPLVGASRAIQEARRFAAKVSGSDLTVLLRGETGTGKDHLAEIIHMLGRPDKPFVVVDCSSLPETLSEAELFGHARGAFTDAREEKVGLVEAAGDGTLFFNEVANMSLSLQAKFLRILDKRPLRPVGSKKEIQVRARIIAATNANLEERMKAQTFRSDLYYRLDVLSFSIPPLRERKEDIPELIESFLNGSLSRFSPAALVKMMAYDWPGNVRQLMSVVQEAVLMNQEGEIGPEQVRLSPGSTDKTALPTLHELELNYLCDVLRQSGGIVNKAARIADVHPRVIFYKIRKFNLRGFVEDLRKRKSPD